ncbi:cupin domain-containing protein [Methanococcoides alaskense]|uniref:Mannose-6-phosphate isomerase-like protein (Cupin superfamily) n=1 Tax=Methanococcoides alaskense TaxID=325778 RepID=A0AA90U0H8_9EURY|nr:cupin domain-containing protein [Methanococcoides alaskense]MDR6223331.1 mannose-6-phosphate isomerase-like protein (cupin superfamily) [Methanococcoides alaskense]
MKIIELSKAPEKENTHNVIAKGLYDSEQTHVVHFELKPGEALKLHKTPMNVLFYVLEGEGIVVIGDEEESVSKDMLIESPKGIPHLLRNESDSLFKFLVVKLKE